ncbi:hypothetical protein L596_020886 [Steinernema carpocapsae]|uniref:7TM GPCR serpentine receptor class x (Srx) domain-containing protein n=1 Tax=Steinernema carpocapsae TaxID=34508 RepID=A0A4U5MUV2_STECR|nr:hypothetical protein L596_020886 [Steinernema carpocapsae]
MLVTSLLTFVLACLCALKKRYKSILFCKKCVLLRELSRLSARQVSIRYELANTIRNTTPVIFLTTLLCICLLVYHVLYLTGIQTRSNLINITFAVYTILFSPIFIIKCSSVLKPFPSAKKWIQKKTKSKLQPAYRYDSSVWAVGVRTENYGSVLLNGSFDCNHVFFRYEAQHVNMGRSCNGFLI